MDGLPGGWLRRAGSGRGGLLSGMAAVRLFSRDASVKRITSSARFRKGSGSGEERSTRAPVIFLARLCKNWKNGRMEKLMQALLIIDVQNDYFPGGRFELAGAVEALERTRAVLDRFREKGLPVIFVQHINTRPDASFFLPDTVGAEIHPDIAPAGDEPIVVKHAPNSFFRTNLLELLQAREVNELVVCGMMTHMCIDTTVRAAKDYGIPVTLLYDACAARDLKIMEHSIPAQTVQDAYMAGLNGMFAEIKLAEQLEL